MHPIGFLDSGVGGLNILDEVQKIVPEYDSLYFGDSAHAPYGNKDQGTLYTLVETGTRWLFDQGCPLVIYACNTASATVLREIQQKLLPEYAGRKVLGIVRPTIEEMVQTGHKNILIFATPATVASEAYEKELKKIDPDLHITSHACPTWGPLVEAGKANTPYAEEEVKKEVRAAHEKNTTYDAVLLACTHYPYLAQSIKKHIRADVDVYNQGDLVAQSLRDYLLRHPEIETQISKEKRRRYTVTGDASLATELATRAFGYSIQFEQVEITTR